jgi:hypothetical protein
MSSTRKTMPTGKKLEKLKKELYKKNRAAYIHYNSATHKLLLYAKFKKKAFSWDDWNNFHADNYPVRRNSGDCFQHLLLSGFVYHRIIDGTDYFQITPDGELQLILISERDQARRAKLASDSSARGRMTYLTRTKYND